MNRIPGLASDALFLSAALAPIAAAGSPWQAGADLPAYSGSAPVRVATVVITGFKFEPATVTVHAGDVVKWKNDDITAHTVTADGKLTQLSIPAPSAREPTGSTSHNTKEPTTTFALTTLI